MLIDIIKSLFLICILMTGGIFAENIEIHGTEEISLLEKSEICFSDRDTDLHHLIRTQQFHSYKKPYINIGLQPKTVWIRFRLQNTTSKPLNRIIVLTSPLLKYIALYEAPDKKPQLRGILYLEEQLQQTLFPFYSIELPPYGSRTYYLHTYSDMLPVDFSIQLKEKEHYLQNDRKQQFINILLIGFVLALALYSFILFFYIRDKSYLFYSFYLFSLIYQQITYLGLTQIYFPVDFIQSDIQISVFKVNMLIITAALFAIHFLKIQQIPFLYRIYQLFILLSVSEVILFDRMHYITLYTSILIGAFFIIFNLLSGIISFLKGQRQARLFIVGFSLVFFSYTLIILDALGFTNFMQNFQNILMFGTAFEALILSLAFADRYIILQKEKNRVDQKILKELQNREQIIQMKVDEKTEALNHALEEKELLLQEIHHRVKNNLQIILSIIRLQNDTSLDKGTQDALKKLENRINAIAKTYNILLISNNFRKIDMKVYMDELITDIVEALGEEKGIVIRTNIDMELPLKEAAYVGLVVNELVTNAYKHAFISKKGIIDIALYYEQNSKVLEISDNGKGYRKENKPTSFGLKLIYTLVKHQLKGTILLDTDTKTHYIIRF